MGSKEGVSKRYGQNCGGLERSFCILYREWNGWVGEAEWHCWEAIEIQIRGDGGLNRTVAEEIERRDSMEVCTAELKEAGDWVEEVSRKESQERGMRF